MIGILIGILSFLLGMFFTFMIANGSVRLPW